MLKTICLEEHMSTPEVMEAWRGLDPELSDPVTRWTVDGDVAAPLTDLGDGRIRAMDVAGVDLAVISLTTPGLQSLPTERAFELQAPTNDAIGAAVRRYPDRLQGFATLATSSPKAASLELERCVVDVGLSGALLHTLSQGDFLSDRRYWKIFEAAESRRAPLYLHPSVPTGAVAEQYYDGFGLLRTGGIGWHYQTGLGLLRMILSGVFDQFPHLQVILGHWGEVVLFYLDRSVLLDIDSTLARPLVSYFRENVHVTPGGVASHRYLKWCLEVLGPDRIMHATDYPFNGADDFAARRFLEEADLTQAEREKIGSGNWERLAGDIRR